MLSKKFDLLTNLVTTYGDTTKTFRTSKVTSKTINSKTVLGPPLTKFLSTVDDFGVLASSIFVGKNRVFAIGAISAGLGRVMLYDFDPDTGTATPVGSFNMQFINVAATTHTIRGFKVDDGASSATITGWKIFVATTGSVTANGGLYMAYGVDKADFTPVPTTIPTATLSDTKSVYKLENSPFTLTASADLILDRASTRVYQHNGVAATHQYAKFNYSISTGVPGANGIITTLTEYVTGNLPALTGTLLLTNSGKYAVPAASPAPAGLIGNPCAFFATSTRMYLGLLSELTNGGTTWPSLYEVNNVMPFAPGVYINPTLTAATWSNDVDRIFGNISVAGVGFEKKAENNAFGYFFGKTHNRFLESGGYGGFSFQIFGGITSTQFEAALGWLFAITTTTSQRGIVAAPIAADYRYEQHYFITKVLDVGGAEFYRHLAVISQLAQSTDSLKVQYRTSGFASQTVGWNDGPLNFDYSAIAVGSQIQLRGLFVILSESNDQGQQVEELSLSFSGRTEMDENWRFSFKDSVSSSPARTAFAQNIAYTGTKHFIFSAYLRSTSTLFAQANTLDDPTDFELSTNNGTSYAALAGAIASSPLMNVLRYKWTTPPGVELDVVLQEKP